MGSIDVNTLLPFIVAGIATGAIYGLAGSGLVITYKTSGIFNFAHGAIAAASAYAFYGLTVDVGMRWEPAFVLSVPVLGTVMGLLLEVLARYLSQRVVALQIAATVGVIVTVRALSDLKYGPDTLRVVQYLPGGTGTFRVGGVHIGWGQLWVTVVAVALTGSLYVLLRSTRIGVAMRAVVDDPALVGLHGTNAAAVRRVAWIIGSTLAALSGVLLAPFVGVQAISLTYLVLAAIGAGAFGAFSNIPMTYLGGLVIGVLASVSQKYVVSVSWLSGIPLSLPFIVLVVALLVLPRRKLISRAPGERRVAASERAPLVLAAPMAVLAIAVLILVPDVVGTHLPYYMQGLTLGIMLLSLGLLVRTAGQVSLCQAAFGAIGAVAFSQLIVNFKIPWLLAVVLGASVTIPVAALVALLAMRLSGLFLALATLAFGIMVEQLIYPTSIGFGSGGLSRLMPRPSDASSDHAYYYVLLAFLVVISAAVVVIERSRLGRMLKGLSDSPTAISMMGLTINVTKIIVFCVSAFIAGIAGILYGGTVTVASNGDPNFSSFQSLILLTILVIAPFGAPWYALFAIVVTVLPGYLHAKSFPDWLNLVFGLAAVLFALQGRSAQTPKALRALYSRLSPPKAVLPVSAPSPVTDPREDVAQLGRGLVVEDLKVRFGGLVAVAGVSLDAPIGRITGLIGPNGAGKTSTFNACCGQVRAASGRVLIHGHDITRKPPHARARLGLGRTFQVTELCESLTVYQNVALGREAALAGGNVLTQLVAPRSARRAVHQATGDALELCGISALAEVTAGSLSTGERRLVEVARCLAGDFDMLLLDEPSAGLDHEETENLCQVLRTVVRQRQCGVMLVEHDMALVMRTCDHIYVLDFGALLFEGTPEQVANSPLVQAAYLGSVDAGVVEEVGR
jgi:ABC-type branched-subunit amino acid transport system ATPase component/branched-subunit amino acid ABC-type transport system permease component